MVYACIACLVYNIEDTHCFVISIYFDKQLAIVMARSAQKKSRTGVYKGWNPIKIVVGSCHPCLVSDIGGGGWGGSLSLLEILVLFSNFQHF